MSIACESHMFDTEIDRGELPPDEEDDDRENDDQGSADEVDRSDMTDDDINFPE